MATMTSPADSDLLTSSLPGFLMRPSARRHRKRSASGGGGWGLNRSSFLSDSACTERTQTTRARARAHAHIRNIHIFARVQVYALELKDVYTIIVRMLEAAEHRAVGRGCHARGSGRNG